MSERFWEYGKHFFIMLFIVAFSIVTITAVYNDMDVNATELVAQDLKDNARMFTTQFDEIIVQDFSHLQQLAKRLEGKADKAEILEALRDYKTLFRSVEILDSKGNRKYGDAIDVDLTVNSVLDTILFGGKNVVYGKKIKEDDGQTSILLCVPVQLKNKTTEVLAGTIPFTLINDLMDTWGGTLEGCAFLVNAQGDCLSTGKNFEEILGKDTTSYFTCLSSSILEGEISSISEFQRAILKRDAFSIRYTHSRKNYIAEFYPSSQCNWFMGYIERVDGLYKNRFSFSMRTIVCLVITFILWAVILFFSVYYAAYKKVSLQAELERFSIIHNLEQSLILEMQFSPKRLEFFGDTKKMFGVDNLVLNGEEVFDVYNYVHEDDQSVRGRLHGFYDDEEEGKVFTAELRIKNGTGNYGWYRISGTTIKDKNTNVNLKFIAKIENADQEIAEEKDLVQRAENDLLTGILNKKTMEEKVANALKTVEGNNHCIFFMVDLDNFKNVNDKLGHIFGDKAIVDTANLLTELFPNNAYVGRLGGDEFAVCAIYDAFDKDSMFEYIKKKADKICEVNRRTYTNGTISINISSSVGIAVALDSKQDFETVYKMADSALYRSKNGGKNCYHIYEEP